jgi:uncharacterized RDD family membrane protein YckC
VSDQNWLPTGQGDDPQPGHPVATAPGVPTLNGMALVEWPRRALGGLIDYVAPIFVIWLVLSFIPIDGVRSSLATLANLAWFAYLGYKNGTTGITFGKSIAKIKVVSEATGQPIGVAGGIIRQLAHFIDNLICLVGWLFPLWDAKRQTIADKLMKTVVVDNSADPNAGEYTWWP